MSDLDLDAVEARADAATDGPWFWRNTQGRSGAIYLQGARTRIVMAFKRMGMNGAQPMFRGLDGLLYESADVNINQFPDAEFIAHARTDVPALVAALREARAEVERLRDDLSTAVRGLDAYVGANGASVAERDDWRRRYEALRADYNHLNERLDFAVDCPDCGAHGFITDGRWRG